MQYNIIQYNKKQSSTIQHSTAPYNTLQYKPIQYNINTNQNNTIIRVHVKFWCKESYALLSLQPSTFYEIQTRYDSLSLTMETHNTT